MSTKFKSHIAKIHLCYNITNEVYRYKSEKLQNLN